MDITQEQRDIVDAICVVLDSRGLLSDFTPRGLAILCKEMAQAVANVQNAQEKQQ